MIYVPDRYSSDWLSLKAFLEQELNDYYKRLSALDIPESTAHQIRGTIAFITKLLALENRPTISAPPRHDT